MPQLTAAGRPQAGDEDPAVTVLKGLYRLYGTLIEPLVQGQQAASRQVASVVGPAFPGQTESPLQAVGRAGTTALGLANVLPAGAEEAARTAMRQGAGPAATPRPTLAGRAWPSPEEMAGIIAGAVVPGVPGKPPRFRNLPGPVAPSTPLAQEGVETARRAVARGSTDVRRTAAGEVPEAASRRLVRTVTRERAAAYEARHGMPEPTWWKEMTRVAPSGEMLANELKAIYKRANVPMPEQGGDVGVMRRRNRALVEPERRIIVDPAEAALEGERRAWQALGEQAPAQRNAALYEATPTAKTRADLATTRLASEAEVRAYLRYGIFGQYWYEGAAEELYRGIERLRTAAQRQGIPLPMAGTREEALRLGRNIAATSPLTEPGQNVDNALKAYFEWMAYGRQPGHQFTRQHAFTYTSGRQAGTFSPAIEPTGTWGTMKGQGTNLSRIAAGDPIQGLKVSNYLLNIFGSQRGTTIDRWMVELLLPGLTTGDKIPDATYDLVATRLQDLARQWNTTPARAQAALWTGYKLLHDPDMVKLVMTDLLPEQVVPSLAAHIRGGIDRATTGPSSLLATWLPKNPKMLAALPIIGLATTLIEDDNAYAATAAPMAEGPPSGYGMQGPAMVRPRGE